MTALSLTCATATKKITVGSGTIPALGELVDITVVGLGSVASGLEVELTRNGVVLVTADGFSASGSDAAQAGVDFGTLNMISLFSGAPSYARRVVDVTVWDVTNRDLYGADRIRVKNNIAYSNDSAAATESTLASWLNTTTITASTTLTMSKGIHRVICNSATDITVTLPAAAVDLIITVQNINTGNVTVDPAGSDTLNGATTSVVLYGQHEAMTLVGASGAWYVPTEVSL